MTGWFEEFNDKLTKANKRVVQQAEAGMAKTSVDQQKRQRKKAAPLGKRISEESHRIGRGNTVSAGGEEKRRVG